MSSFLSNKFLEYRRGLAGPPKPIETDLFCTGCGYNLRGLTYGRNCPECGTQIRKNRGLTDVIVDCDIPQRHSMKWGLLLLAATLMGKSFLRMFAFIWLVFFPSSAQPFVLASFDLALGMMWMFGAWMVLPRRLDAHYYKWRFLRMIGRWTPFVFPLGTTLWILAATLFANTSTADGLLSLSSWLPVGGYLGAIGLIFILHRLASDAELETAARRINLAAWMLPIPSIILGAMPVQLDWITMLFLGPWTPIWCWYVLLLGRAVLTMQRHVSWSLRIAEDAPLRFKRVEETRRELDAAVQAQIRPSGGPLQDVPLAMNQPKK